MTSPSATSTIRPTRQSVRPCRSYSEQLAESPLNLHTHGLHVSPKGNADNVMLHMPAGTANTYTYDIPKAHPQGAYWYHSHLHMLTTAHVYFGMVDLLPVGRLDGNLPIVTEKRIPIRNMMLQYNYVFDRARRRAQLNNSTGRNSSARSCRPRTTNSPRAPIARCSRRSISRETGKGARYATVWYEGPLSDQQPARGVPVHPEPTCCASRRRTARPTRTWRPTRLARRQARHAVHGERPVPAGASKSKAGQTEIWVLSNVSDIAYLNLRLTETATGRHPQIAASSARTASPISTCSIRRPKTASGS